MRTAPSPPQAPWPNLALLWATIAKLEHLLERPAAAVQAADRALSLLRVTHGGRGAAADEVARVRHEAGAELAHARQGAPPGRGGEESE